MVISAFPVVMYIAPCILPSHLTIFSNISWKVGTVVVSSMSGVKVWPVQKKEIKQKRAEKKNTIRHSELI